jgi:hypothetical protein
VDHYRYVPGSEMIFQAASVNSRLELMESD